MAWIIDRVHDEHCQDEVGVIGPRMILDEVAERFKSDPNYGVPFRMYDDDHILVYEGRMGPKTANVNPFQPLDDFGTPNYGCTEIHIRHNGRWVHV